jgi:hypothetical protein
VGETEGRRPPERYKRRWEDNIKIIIIIIIILKKKLNEGTDLTQNRDR